MCCVLLVGQAEGFQAVVRPPGTVSASARRAADGVQWTLKPRRPPLAMAAADAALAEAADLALRVSTVPFSGVLAVAFFSFYESFVGFFQILYRASSVGAFGRYVYYSQTKELLSIC